MIDFGDAIWGTSSPRYVRGWCAIVQSHVIYQDFCVLSWSYFRNLQFCLCHIPWGTFRISRFCRKKCSNSAIHKPQKVPLCHQYLMFWLNNYFFMSKKVKFGKVTQSWTLTESPPLLARVEITLQTQWKQEKLTFHILTFFFLGAKQKGQR